MVAPLRSGASSAGVLHYHLIMQVTLLANAGWLDEELTGFRYLTVGLIDEQVRVAQVVPESLPAEDAIPFGERVTWADSNWAWLRRRRLLALTGDLDKIEPDVIHIMHHTLWEGGLALAEELEAAAVLQVSSEEDVRQAPRITMKVDATRVAFSVTTQPLTQALTERVASAFTVRTIKPGVRGASAPSRAHPTTPDVEPPLCAIISGQPRFDASYDSLFVAMKRLIADHPEAQFFLDAPTEADPALWQAARKHGILANLSMVPHRLGHRELELAADVIIHPQAMRRSRSLTLQAMAHGVPIIAQADPWLDYLIDDQTAWLINAPSATRWEEMLRHLIVAPDQGEALGSRAREWVGKHHLASQQVEQTIELYRGLTAEAIRFPG